MSTRHTGSWAALTVVAAALIGGCAQAPARSSADVTGACQVSGGAVSEGFFVTRPGEKGAATPELALAEYVTADPPSTLPTEEWVRQTPSLFERGQRMVHVAQRWELDVTKYADGTWGIDGGRRCA
ncbi:MAG: hypothetical protein IPF90_11600 [Actinomycetales bacterium]|nr:hypothetical protein [Candidatus Phosphoribacter baldrii]